MSESTDPKPDKPSPADGRSFMVVGGLMLLIILLLAVLWVRERQAHARTTADLTKLRRERTGSKEMFAKLFQQASPQIESALQPPAGIGPGDLLSAQPTTIDGTVRTTVKISAAAGRRLRLSPGTIILVDRPVSAPASQPAPHAPPSTD